MRAVIQYLSCMWHLQERCGSLSDSRAATDLSLLVATPNTVTCECVCAINNIFCIDCPTDEGIYRFSSFFSLIVTLFSSACIDQTTHSLCTGEFSYCGKDPPDGECFISAFQPLRLSICPNLITVQLDNVQTSFILILLRRSHIVPEPNLMENIYEMMHTPIFAATAISDESDKTLYYIISSSKNLTIYMHGHHN